MGQSTSFHMIGKCYVWDSMGVVKRQGVKRSIVTYLGVIVGMVSTIFIYPLDFDTAGMAQFIIALASLIVPFASVGINKLTVRYFPDFKTEDGYHHGFLPLLLSTATVAFLLFTGIILLSEDLFVTLLDKINMRIDIFLENKFIVLIIAFLMVLNVILVDMTSNYGRIVIPAFFNNLLFKVSLPILVLLVYFDAINMQQFKSYLIISYAFAFLGLAVYLKSLGGLRLKFDLGFVSTRLAKQMAEYSIYGALSTLGYLLAFRIDAIMIGSLVKIGSVAEYNFFSTMVNVMAIPYVTIVAIASPILAANFKKEKYGEIGSLYRMSSETMIVAGGLLLVGTWACLDDLIALTSQQEILAPLKLVYLVLAVGYLVNMATGFNEQLISYSKYFRFSMIAMLILATFNIILNLYLIPRYGLVGAAAATTISFSLYNTIKLIFIKIKLDMFPFSFKHILVVIIIIVTILITGQVSTNFHPVINILILGSLSVVLYMGPILLLRLSPEVNDLVKQGLDRVRGFIR